MMNVFNHLFLLAAVAGPVGADPSATPTWKPSLVALTVEDLDATVAWYRESFGFSVEERERYDDHHLEFAILVLDGQRLELVRFDRVLDPAALLPEGAQAVNGLLKIGFRVADIEGLSAAMTKRGVEFVAPLSPLPRLDGLPPDWPESYFLVRDPDGNYVQVFSGGEADAPPRLFLAAIAVADLETSIAWYGETLGTKELGRVGDPGNERALLGHGRFFVEIAQLAGTVPRSEAALPDGARWDAVRGIKKIGLHYAGSLEELAAALEAASVPIPYPLRPSDRDWAEAHFIAEDPDGVHVQFFR